MVSKHFVVMKVLFIRVEVRQSVHRHTIQIIHQQDATVSQVYYLTFMCGSTCFGCLFAHHQEHTTALGALGFTVGEWRLKHFGRG
jgi:hypothetical protein